MDGSGSRGPITSQPCPSPSTSRMMSQLSSPLAGTISRARISPPHSRDGWQLPPRQMSWDTGVRTLHSPRCGARGDEYPAPHWCYGTGASDRRGSPQSPWELTAGCSQPEALAAAGNGGSAVAVSCLGSARQRTAKGLRWLLGGRECECPRAPRSMPAEGSGACPGKGAALLLPFCTPGLRDPHAWLFPSLNKVSPTGSGGKRGRGWGGGRAGPPSAHPRAASPQPPAAPPCLPRRCGEARKRVQEKGNPISDPAGEAFK